MRRSRVESFDCAEKEIGQFPDFSVRVTCRNSTETINPIKYQLEGRKLIEAATESEIGQMRIVIGSLGW
eukprot:7339438-Karenia_brevis.AAC.1